MGKNAKKWGYIIIFGLFCANAIAYALVYNLARDRYLKVVFFDVGQGDSEFIETPSGQQVLIDGGPSSAVLPKLAREMPFYDRTLDLIILTHPEKDHIFGLLEVLKRYKVKNILWTGAVKNSAEYKEWKDLIKKEGANIVIAEAGEKIILESKKREIFIDILNPREDLSEKNIENENDASIVSRLSFSNISFLFSGDVSSDIERGLVGGGYNLKSDVLKVAHHGSKTSSSIEFLKAVSPEAAVIEVGKGNQYGHPSPEVLENLKKFGIEVKRTDVNGDVEILCDGWQCKTNN